MLNIHQLKRLCGIRSNATVYAQVRKGNLAGKRYRRSEGGHKEWLFEQPEAERFLAWYQATPRLQR